MINCVHVPLFRGMSSMLPVLYHFLEEEKLCKRYYSDLQAGGAPPTHSRWSRSILYEPVWWRRSHLAEIFAGAITSLNSHKRELSWERIMEREEEEEERERWRELGAGPERQEAAMSFSFFFFLWRENVSTSCCTAAFKAARRNIHTRCLSRGKPPAGGQDKWMCDS